MKLLLTSLFFLFILNISFSQDLESQIDNIVSSIYKENEPGIVMLIAKDGKPIYRKAYGKSNLELETPITLNSVLQIGSITKQFTAIAILMLEEKGKLRVKDEIIKYIPNYPTKGKGITIHHLLNHTSGIKNSTPSGNQSLIARTDMTSTELIDYFKNKPMDFEPGEQFKYSNAGYIILGRIIEIVSGLSYEDFIEKNIFEKLGMTKSYYGSNKEIIKNRAAGYQYIHNKYINANYMSLTLPYSAGSLMSNVDDLLKWHNAITSNTLIKRSSLKKAINPSTLNDGKKIPYGYGWRIGNLNGSKVIAHNGGTFGYTASGIFITKENIYIIALTNCNCKSIKNVPDVTKKIATMIINQTSTIDKTVEISSEILKQYIGTYRLKPNANIKITKIGNSLFLQAPKELRKNELFAKDENHFFVKGSSVKIIFNSNDKGKIVSLTLNQGTRQVSANKIK
ncbi:CubicO group peptidase (beta-lactamase class C family) [Aquimarina sp. EL_43]|uniref:serine hydrolase n=1 Tax=unclassified Aquimarina TaxID=2627091 RepID=UPI0018CBAB50|nr:MULTISPECIES: serine hydrolase [unclassified Aquimarina]MBG6129513.1 CubicO group peptidase (beta-lactamase class C family) [Aquimarina sp. EL_35]MBG6150578.1 CubicO group peptidase (beta-lactamase class C family) [Aquimarina sp. EL_32]MBG6168114.1 CubicO group peptidase (beta-lactamase class C family) [Aquimarina sp. EL_43]